MKRKFVLSVVLITLLLIYGCFYSEFANVDKCMDRGGCWDETAKVCRMDEPNAQERCDKSRGNIPQ